jgi:multiple sugar transport system ATP-binding protein
MVVEPLGSHALVTVLVGNTQVKVQAPIDVAVRPDEAIRLRFDEATLRWMDAGTGSAIRN